MSRFSRDDLVWLLVTLLFCAVSFMLGMAVAVWSWM